MAAFGLPYYLIIISCIIGLNISATQLSGTFITDKYLNAANSPYILTGDILIESTASLIIQNNVTINLNSYNIELYGNIISGCNDNITYYSKNRGINDMNFIYIYNGEEISIKDGGFGQFCNTKFELMSNGIVADGDIIHNESYIIDHCQFNLIQNDALQFNIAQRYFVTNTIFTNITNTICLCEGNVEFDNCIFNNFDQLFDNTPNDITIINSKISNNGNSACIEVYDDLNNKISNNIIKNCVTNGIQINHYNDLQPVTNKDNYFIVSGNDISNCQQYAIRNYGANIVIKDNLIHDNLNAMYIEENMVQIINNTFKRNTGNQVMSINLDNQQQGILKENTFIDNGDINVCNQLLYINGNGAKYQIEKNIFKNNHCKQTLIDVTNLKNVILTENNFIDNDLSMTMTSKLIDISVAITSSTINTFKNNLSIINNNFYETQNYNNLYLNGYDIINIKQNEFNASSATAPTFIVISDGKSNDMLVSENTFYGENIDNFISLYNTTYNVTANNNFFNGINQTRQVSAKIHDFCDNKHLGHIKYCPWIVELNSGSTIDCDANCNDLCNGCNKIIDNNHNNNNDQEIPSLIPTESPTPGPIPGPTQTDLNSQVPTETIVITGNPTRSKTTTTKSPTFRPTRENLSPFPTKQPTEFYGAIFYIDLYQKFNHNQISDILTNIINEIIDEKVNDICETKIDFNATTKTNISSINGTLFVCDQDTERDLMFYFESENGIKQFENRLILDINNNTNNTVDQVLIMIIIEGKSIRNTDIFGTTKIILNVSESSSNKQRNNEHILYILIVTGVLVLAFCIGVIQYCRYERNEPKAQESLVRDKNKENMCRMINVNKHQFEPGSKHLLSNSLHLCDEEEEEDEHKQKKKQKPMQQEKKQNCKREEKDQVRLQQNPGEMKCKENENELMIVNTTNCNNNSNGYTTNGSHEILVDSDSENNNNNNNNDNNDYKTSSNEELLKKETRISDYDHDGDDENDESIIIEGDDRMITRDMGLAIPETIK